MAKGIEDPSLGVGVMTMDIGGGWVDRCDDHGYRGSVSGWVDRIVAKGIEDPSLGVGVMTMDIEDPLVGGWIG